MPGMVLGPQQREHGSYYQAEGEALLGYSAAFVPMALMMVPTTKPKERLCWGPITAPMIPSG